MDTLRFSSQITTAQEKDVGSKIHAQISSRDTLPQVWETTPLDILVLANAILAIGSTPVEVRTLNVISEGRGYYDDSGRWVPRGDDDESSELHKMRNPVRKGENGYEIDTYPGCVDEREEHGDDQKNHERFWDETS